MCVLDGTASPTHQRDGYAVLMQATAGAIIELARDPRFVGGTVAVLAVLHTWDQQLNLHPHVHCLVSGGGISEDGTTWHPARRTFLLPIKALARKVRGKFRALLRQRCPELIVPDVVWHKDWLAHVTAWGSGEGGRIVSVAAIIAVAVNAEGKREIVGLHIGPSEAETFWSTFLKSLLKRGLKGVKLVISDAHEGLKAAIARVLRAGWQRCRVHYAAVRIMPTADFKPAPAAAIAAMGSA